MSFEPSSLERARKRAAARAITEKRNCIRACYGSASWKTNRSFRPPQGGSTPRRARRPDPRVSRGCGMANRGSGSLRGSVSRAGTEPGTKKGARRRVPNEVALRLLRNLGGIG